MAKDEDQVASSARVERRLKQESRLYPVKHLLDELLAGVLVALLLVLYLEFFATLGPRQHAAVVWVQRLILLYFVLELLVDLWLYRRNRQFLRDKWIDILLVIPFLTVVRGATQALRALKLIKPAKAAKAGKAAKPVKAAKVSKSGKVLHARKPLKQAKIVQKIGKILRKLWHRLTGH